MVHTEEQIIALAKELFDKHDNDKISVLDERQSRNFVISWLRFVNPKIPFQEWFFQYRFGQFSKDEEGRVAFGEFTQFVIAKARGAKLLA